MSLTFISTWTCNGKIIHKTTSAVTIPTVGLIQIIERVTELHRVTESYRELQRVTENLVHV